MNAAGRGWKGGDRSLFESCGPFRSSADLPKGYVRSRSQLEFGQESSDGNVCYASESADPDRLTFESFSRVDRGLNHQLVIQHIDKTSHRDEIAATGGRVYDSTSGNHANLDVIAQNRCGA